MCGSISRCCSSIAYLACCPCRTTFSIVSGICRAADAAIDRTAKALLSVPLFIGRKTFAVIKYPFGPNASEELNLTVWASGTAFLSYWLADAIPLILKRSQYPLLESTMGCLSLPMVITLMRTAAYIYSKGIPLIVPKIESRVLKDVIVLGTAAALGTGMKLYEMGYLPK
jgi:hypothetical protein